MVKIVVKRKKWTNDNTIVCSTFCSSMDIDGV